VSGAKAWGNNKILKIWVKKETLENLLKLFYTII
jgi:hypothetical protein